MNNLSKAELLERGKLYVTATYARERLLVYILLALTTFQ